MKVAFDHLVFMLQRYGGISRYLVRLAEQLSVLGHEPRIFAPAHCNHYLTELSDALVAGRPAGRLPDKALRVLAPLVRAQAGKAIRGFAPDVLHETYYDPTPLRAPGLPRIVTVHDMIHERYATGAATRIQAHKRAAVARADHIICVSECTKRDLCEMLHVPEAKVSVVYHGYEVLPVSGAAPKIGPRPYLLFVGHRGGYKNFEALLRAVAASPELAETYDIVAFGGAAFSPQEQNLAQSLGFSTDRLWQLAGDDATLGALYSAAAAFVYPSRYEGFGMPLLEAMALGCPVVSSRASAMPEVAGAAAEYFDPDEGPEALAEALRRALQPPRRAELISLGHKQLEEFSWQRCARETLTVYQRAIDARES